MKNKLFIILPIVVVVGLFVYGFFELKGFKQGLQTSPDVKPITYKDLIEIDSPVYGSTISNPVTVAGKARGNWYFEASFPVQIVDEDGTILGSAPAQAQGAPGGWMTGEYVPFSAQISFSKPKGKTGKVIFKKDNPSGDPARDDSVSIPIVFK